MNSLRSRPIDLFELDHDWLASRLPHEVWTEAQDLIAALMLLWELPESDHDDDDERYGFVAVAQFGAIEAAGRVIGRLLDASEEAG